MNVNLFTQKSAQQKLADALNAMLDGHNVRYFIKPDGTWFVAKDVVEAANGIYNATHLKESLGEDGLYTMKPILDELGREQETLLVHHKGVIKWATKSRLPKAKKIESLVWEIIGDAADGKVINQVIKPQLTASEEAMRQFVSKCEMAIPMMRDLLGYGQGALRKTAIEIGLKVEKDTLEKVLPNQLKYDPDAGIAIEKDLTKGTHAVMKKLGTEGWNASTIAESFGRKITPTDVNKALIELGLQVPMNANTLRNGYTPTPKAEDLCNAEPRAGGKYKGFKAIRSWMYLEIQDKVDPILTRMSTEK